MLRSPRTIICTQSSNVFRSIPRTKTPAAFNSRNTPQTFSRGLCKLTITGIPGAMPVLEFSTSPIRPLNKLDDQYSLARLALHYPRDSLPASDAKCSEPAARISPSHFVEQRDEYPCTARANGMAKSDRATVYVDAIAIEAQFLH